MSEMYIVDYSDIDLANSDSVVKLVRNQRPDIIINATAYTAVDQAEEQVVKQVLPASSDEFPTRKATYVFCYELR